MAFGGTEVKVWDARTAMVLRDLTEQTTAHQLFPDQRGGSVSFTRDGADPHRGDPGQEETGRSRRKVCDARTGAVLVELQGNVGPVLSASFGPDGTRIVTGGWGAVGRGTVKVWDARTGAAVEPFELKGHTGYVNSVSFSPDGTRIVTGSGDRTVKLWDARTGTELLELKGHTGFVMSASFSPDGTDRQRRVREGGKPGQVIVWDARTGKELPDEEELAYRRLHTQPNPWRYREGYQAARADNDDFAGRFYLNLLPPAERTALIARADVDALVPPLSDRAKAHRNAREWEQELPLLVEIANVTKAKLGPEDPATLEAMTQLGDAYGRMKQFDKSILVFEEVLKGQEAKLGRGHPVTLGTVAKLGQSYNNAGRFKEAIPLLEEADPHAIFVGAWALGDAYAKAGEYAKLTKYIHKELAEARKPQQPDDDPREIESTLGYVAVGLAQLLVPLLQSKAFAEAEALLRECLPLCEKTLPDDWRTYNTKSLLGGALLGQKKYAEAEPLLLAGYEGMKQREKTILPEVARNSVMPAAIDRLIELYTATNKPDEAKKWRAERAKYPDVASPPREKK